MQQFYMLHLFFWTWIEDVLSFLMPFFICSDDWLSAGPHSAFIFSSFLCFESVDSQVWLAADQGWSLEAKFDHNNSRLKNTHTLLQVQQKDEV